MGLKKRLKRPKQRFKTIYASLINPEDRNNSLMENISDIDVVIVLGCTDPKILEERMSVAIEAYKNVKKLLFTGGMSYFPKIARGGMVPEAIRMKEIAMQAGILEKDIIIEDKAKDTVQNFENSFAILEQMNEGKPDSEQLKSILVITSDYHITRSMLLLRSALARMGLSKKYNTFFKYNQSMKETMYDRNAFLCTKEAILLLLSKKSKRNKIHEK